jgi:hypothetical protein
MTNKISLQYFANIFYLQHRSPIAILLYHGDHFFLALLKENRQFEYHILPVVDSKELVYKKINEVYIVSRNFVVYTDSDPEEVKQYIPAVQYIQISDSLLKKYTIDITKIKTLVLAVVACVLLVAVVYRLLYPKKEEIKQIVTEPPPPPYHEVYTNFLKNRLNGSIRTVENFLNRKTLLKPAEFFRMSTSDPSGISATVVSLVYRPGYNREGDLYVKTLNQLPERRYPLLADVIKNPEPEKCTELSPAEYTVVEYEVQNMPQPPEVRKTYQVKVAKLEYSTASVASLLKVLYKSLETCTIVEKIEEKNDPERRFTVYAAKYRPD